MSPEVRHHKLLAALSSATEKGFRWQDTTEENTFRLPLPSGRILITEVPERTCDSDFDEYQTFPTWKITVLDSDGRVVEEFWAEEDEERALMADLFRQARESALDAEEVVEKIIRDLEKAAPMPS